MFDWLQHGFMVQALIACAALGVLLGYLGIHVVGRGIVFVDLALGQVSSLGVALADWAGWDPVMASMGLTLAAAAVFSGLRVRDERLRLEAVIGIFYAAASAATVLLIAKTPHGEADIQDVLFGNVLAQDAGQVRTMLAVFAVVAVAHALLGRRFFALTYRHAADARLSRGEHGLNLAFYVLLALAIVFAIRAGGVIPVFAFLILPPVAALVFARRNAIVIVLATLFAALASFLGLHVSFVYDLPAGASIVAVLGAIGLLAGVWAVIRGRRGTRRAAALGLLIAALLAASTAPARAVDGIPAPTPTTAEADAGHPIDVATLAARLADLEAELARANTRIATLEATLAAGNGRQAAAVAAAAPPAPVPPPPVAPLPIPAAATAAPARGALKLLDVSLSGLFAAAGSTAGEDDFRVLELGGHDPKNRGITAQNVELSLAGAVDPYLRGDAYVIFQIDEEGETVVELEEAYLTTLALPAGLQVKAGTFFAPFGRLNPSHPHSWAFADQPVINGRLFGGDGLRGPAAQLAWLLPTPFFAEATLAVGNGNGETATSFRFSPGEEVGGRVLDRRPVRSPRDLLYTGRLATSFDLTSALTLVPAASYARGPNATGLDSDTSIAGFDLYAKWRPRRNDHGWPFATLQLEAMERRYEAAAFTDPEAGVALPAETLVDRGFYLQGTWGFRRRWVAGLRYDWADGRGDTGADPLRDLRRRYSANVSFYPSEFSKLRLQLNHDRAEHLVDDVTSLLLQVEFLYGAHGGHRF